MFEQINLHYAFDDLEPHFDTLTMETHYLKHHATYTKNLNNLTEASGINDKPIEVILANWKRKIDGKSDAKGIRNNGGGYFNHNLFFDIFQRMVLRNLQVSLQIKSILPSEV